MGASSITYRSPPRPGGSARQRHRSCRQGGWHAQPTWQARSPGVEASMRVRNVADPTGWARPGRRRRREDGQRFAISISSARTARDGLAWRAVSIAWRWRAALRRARYRSIRMLMVFAPVSASWSGSIEARAGMLCHRLYGDLAHWSKNLRSNGLMTLVTKERPGHDDGPRQRPCSRDGGRRRIVKVSSSRAAPPPDRTGTRRHRGGTSSRAPRR
jgi:hypothetical protein